jgi:hypothetical protein
MVIEEATHLGLVVNSRTAEEIETWLGTLP